MKTHQIFRIVSLIEGISYLVLLFVAMPLKYAFDQPEYVRLVGSAHGFLFIAFVVALVVAAVVRKWGVLTPISFFVLSMIPFGFMAIEYMLRRELEEVGPEASGSQ